MKPLCLLVASLLLACPFSVFAQKTFTLNTADKPPYSSPENDGFYDLLLQKAFSRIGIDVKINHLPSARSIKNVALGIDDAEFARIAGLSSKYPNIVMVDEELMKMRFTAFSKKPELSLSSWQDLSNYSIGHIRGWMIFEKNIPTGTETNIVASDEEMFDLLLNDRVDLVLYDELRGREYLERKGIKTIFPSQQPLASRGMHLYVNKKHEFLIPNINKALAEAKQ